MEPLPFDLPPAGPRWGTPADLREPSAGPVRYTVTASPLGDLLLLSDGEALTGVHMSPAAPPEGAEHAPDAFGTAVKELDAYFAGELREFSVPLAPRGTPFQLRVWRQLTAIPYGTTVSYGDIAAALEAPGASRAVGTANNRNPLSIVIPCHRVIGADGAMVGYGGGLERKERLLRLEGIRLR
ncbi:methylated-DNA--[protein]-cysteine S-methyltransferase [Nocardiopsis sp. RSe5-2]|uniref:Methylated-DNA--protein-cysteine methyltransferase n=1 Tax=Nocardiopsis endophytica TaxID=3018445 RepID=A0ABT4UD84_9ACTN|nr:methylated-DNA--[protein]-cysteine S-methyltransferase [Nocardiopsis endophytica]MDA2814852.1 methylated-DNA--[protein]-cysteine S-methyltransferase [Nocardiopsis endophytica]